VRDGGTQTVHATLDTMAPAKGERSSGREESEGTGYGLTVQPLTPQIARELQLTKHTEGVVVSDVDPDGAAATADIRAGDVITQVNGEAVTSPSELKAALTKVGNRPALLLITRNNTDAFVTVKK
jgi:serine protease Do